MTLRRALAHGLLSLLLLPYESRVLLDAIARTLFRLVVRRRGLLEWTPAAQVPQQQRGSFGSMLVHALRDNWISPLLALLLAVVIRVFAPTALVAASQFLLAWLLAPWMMVRSDE